MVIPYMHALQHGHAGCPMKDLTKTSTTVKTGGQLEFSIKSYGLKTIGLPEPLSLGQSVGQLVHITW